ncbi:unnamed protein product [Ilex paraguariensis]|uniref:Uncharacterized protein n=1 Tax=Ilex paraguariensis TaxID=185542 RepID=A0ABC8U8A0_9AQUA
MKLDSGRDCYFGNLQRCRRIFQQSVRYIFLQNKTSIASKGGLFHKVGDEVPGILPSVGNAGGHFARVEVPDFTHSNKLEESEPEDVLTRIFGKVDTADQAPKEVAELKGAPPELEDGGQATVDELIKNPGQPTPSKKAYLRLRRVWIEMESPNSQLLALSLRAFSFLRRSPWWIGLVRSKLTRLPRPLLSSLLPSALLSSGRIGPFLLANLLAIVVSNIYPIPACPAVPALGLDVALSEVAEDSIDAPVLSAAVVDALYFFLSIPVQLSCSSYGSYKRRSVKASS